MGFLRFGSKLNIIFGTLTFIIGLALGIVGIIIKESPDTFVSWFPDNVQEELKTVIAENGMDFDMILKILADHGFENSTVTNFLNDVNPIDFLIGFGFGLVVYTIIVQFVLTTILLKKVKESNLGSRNEPRLFGFIVGVLSLLWFIFPGVLMILGLFGSSKNKRRRHELQRNNRRY